MFSEGLKFWLLVLLRKCRLLQNSLTCALKCLLGNYRKTLKYSICTMCKDTNAQCLHRNSLICSPWMNFQAKVSEDPYSHFEVAQTVK